MVQIVLLAWANHMYLAFPMPQDCILVASAIDQQANACLGIYQRATWKLEEA